MAQLKRKERKNSRIILIKSFETRMPSSVEAYCECFCQDHYGLMLGGGGVVPYLRYANLFTVQAPAGWDMALAGIITRNCGIVLAWYIMG